MARESVNVNFKLYTDDESDLALIEFLKDKPTTYISKEALKLYMRSYTNFVQGSNTPAPEPEQKQGNSSMGKKFIGKN